MSDEPMPCHAKMVDGRLCPRPAATCEWHPRDPLEAAMGEAMRRSLSEPGPAFPIDAAPTTLRIAGRWRVYFHRVNPDGMPWCVAPDSGAWEMAVRSISMVVPTQAVYRAKTTPDDEDGRPSAWIEADGVLVVNEDGVAIIEAAP